jgi:hypothetical protein
VCLSGVVDLRVQSNDSVSVWGLENEGAVMEKDFDLVDFFGSVLERGCIHATGGSFVNLGTFLFRIVERDQRESVGSGWGGGGHA